MKICAIIITHNHEDIISDLVLRCRHALEPDVLLLDARSTVETLARAASAGAIVLDSERGEGDSLINRGLKAALELDYSHAVLVWAHRSDICIPEEIPRLVNTAWNRPDGIIIGVDENGRGNLWTSLSALRPLGAQTSGFRLYPIEETLALQCREEGHAFDAESLVRASWAGIPTAPVPVNTRPSTPSLQKPLFGQLERRLLLGMLRRLPRLLMRRLAEI